MSSEPELQFTAPVKLIYFGVGFTLSAALTAVILTVLRPMILQGPEWLRGAAMLGPLVVGVPFGLRVLKRGAANKLRLFSAIKQALRP